MFFVMCRILRSSGRRNNEGSEGAGVGRASGTDRDGGRHWRKVPAALKTLEMH